METSVSGGTADAKTRCCQPTWSSRFSSTASSALRRLAERGARRAHMDVTDVHALTTALDDIVDHAEEAADELVRYSVDAPLEAAEALAETLEAAIDACETVANVLEGASLKRGRSSSATT
jgi:hypothetical protein